MQGRVLQGKISTSKIIVSTQQNSIPTTLINNYATTTTTVSGQSTRYGQPIPTVPVGSVGSITTNAGPSVSSVPSGAIPNVVITSPKITSTTVTTSGGIQTVVTGGNASTPTANFIIPLPISQSPTPIFQNIIDFHTSSEVQSATTFLIKQFSDFFSLTNLNSISKSIENGATVYNAHYSTKGYYNSMNNLLYDITFSINP